VRPKPKHRLTVQMDELWSFVDHKGDQQWVWLAMDVTTREIVGCYIGDRSRTSAQALWDSLPAVYRQCAVIYSDFWVSYPVALPSKRHRAVGKETGFTSYIERFNCTLRQRVSRLVRKTLSNSCEVGKSHQCDLEFHPSLQCLSPYQLILSSLGLPNFRSLFRSAGWSPRSGQKAHRKSVFSNIYPGSGRRQSGIFGHR